MGNQLFAAVVDGVAERDKLINNAGDRASVEHVDATATSVEDLAREIVRKAIAASAIGIGEQMRAVFKHVKSEAEAIKVEDPRTVKAVTSIDIAQRESERMSQSNGSE